MMDKEKQGRRIADEIEDTFYAYHTYPHMAMVPDFFVRLGQKSNCEHFDVPFNKPKLASEYDAKIVLSLSYV